MNQTLSFAGCRGVLGLEEVGIGLYAEIGLFY